MDRRTFIAGASAAALLPALPLATQSLAQTEEVTVRLRELYKRNGDFTKYATDRAEQRVSIRGFMAPPLKADARFFVLTNRPMAVCPFCESSVDWPEDILAIYLKRVVDVVPFNVPIIVRGRLELGEYTDPDTGFVSRVRLTDSNYERA
ncbi:hypothetical protein DLJ53_05745 [Acuticoccus sediminis]|uniref:Secreted protein n=1 Tax=Acuticoccus sediminis TaxID=2184697 RepID=A0A8B2NYS8_9HYPH|nr:hypothetical protein [Acuticoccus sediminis]RAI04533.1 hypothetical protein DLJ53_05745 [Acuticoccus sediminis]